MKKGLKTTTKNKKFKISKSEAFGVGIKIDSSSF